MQISVHHFNLMLLKSQLMFICNTVMAIMTSQCSYDIRLHIAVYHVAAAEYSAVAVS